MIYLTIEDTGKGIDDAHLIEIFEPFSRLGEQEYGADGAGIGLSIVKQLTEVMEGEIEVDSRVGTGTRFSIGIPRAKAPSSHERVATEPRVMALANEKCAKILYIEDNQINMILMQGILSEYLNLELFCADTGMEGILLAIKEKPDLIFTDINLPDLNGYEVLERLKANGSTASIPVIAITASAFKSEVDKGMKAGFLKYMTKPVEADEVYSAIQDNV